MIIREQEGAYSGFLRVTLASAWWKKFGILCLVCAAAAIALPAQTLTTLHSFSGPPDGAAPFAGLVQATDGSFYGTTDAGGIYEGCFNGYSAGCGAAFKITPSGAVSILHSFCAQGGMLCPDGYHPLAPVIQATDGNFYGTTPQGGAHNAGTVFKITASGTLTTLYAFCSQSQCADGGYDGFTGAGLVQGADGNFYGTTPYGGTNLQGTVFKITPAGALTVLYSFCSGGYGCPDGYYAITGLVQGTDGNFYGTTDDGGNLPPNNGGTVFKITPSGALTTLYSFCSQGGTACADGNDPWAGLVQGTDGNFYGTTTWGGAHDRGTVFKITPSGTLTTLYSFCSQGGEACTDGNYPNSALLQASDGNFYGTTDEGGNNNTIICGDGGCGTLFQITPTGTLTTLYSFCSQSNCADGANPFTAALVQATEGNLYGTTADGGTSNTCIIPYGCGTVFKLSLGQAPAVNLNPVSLTFGPQRVQAPNTPQVVTLTNTGQASLSITSIAVTGQNSGDFAQANNCPISPNALAPGDYCSITVYFFPAGAGTLSADVTVTDNAPGSPQNVSLTGTGVSGKPGLAGPRGARQAAKPVAKPLHH
ncbi:MAG: choice-of-anchor tandem repeat GloVer-containing protein [Terriglobia bacterium]